MQRHKDKLDDQTLEPPSSRLIRTIRGFDPPLKYLPVLAKRIFTREKGGWDTKIPIEIGFQSCDSFPHHFSRNLEEGIDSMFDVTVQRRESQLGSPSIDFFFLPCSVGIRLDSSPRFLASDKPPTTVYHTYDRRILKKDFRTVRLTREQWLALLGKSGTILGRNGTSQLNPPTFEPDIVSKFAREAKWLSFGDDEPPLSPPSTFPPRARCSQKAQTNDRSAPAPANLSSS